MALWPGRGISIASLALPMAFLIGCDRQRARPVAYECNVAGGRIVQLPPGVQRRPQPLDGPGMAELVTRLAGRKRSANALVEATRLCRYVRGKTTFGMGAFRHFLYTPAMLKRLQEGRGDTAMTCGPASMLLVSMCLAHGIEARLVFIYSLAGNELRSHTFVEAWGDERQKWFIVDPSFGAIWLNSEGVPADALDLQDEYRRTRGKLDAFAFQPRFEEGEVGRACQAEFKSEFLSSYFDVIAQSTATDSADPRFALRPGDFLDKMAGCLMYHAADTNRAAAHPGWQRYVLRYGFVEAADRGVWRWRPNQIEIRVLERRPHEVVLSVRHNIAGCDRIEWWRKGSTDRRLLQGDRLVLPAAPPGTYFLQGHSRLGGKTKRFEVEIAPKPKR